MRAHEASIARKAAIASGVTAYVLFLIALSPKPSLADLSALVLCVLDVVTLEVLPPHDVRTDRPVSCSHIRSGRPSSPPYDVPLISPYLASAIQAESIGSFPRQYPRASSLSLPSPPRPCARGLTPLNPLSTPPCV